MSRLVALGELVRAIVDDRPAPNADPVLVRKHGLAPLAYTHGRSLFRADYALSSIRAEQQRELACEAVATLGSAGIQVILLKGISYAGELYKDPAERPMSDVDLMVPVADHPRAVAVLEGIGYRHAGPKIQRSHRHHAMTLKRPGAAVDLHRSPTQEGRVDIPMREVWRRVTPASRVPGASRLQEDDEILFHLANLARHDLIVPLISFVDAGRMLRHLDTLARQRLVRKAHEWRFGRVFDACVEAVEIVCGRNVTRERWWLPARNSMLAGERPSRPVQIGRKLLLVEGPRELLSYARSVADGWVTSLRSQ
ncbi:MAG: nucleotidyltransferase family protein [Deltaproteobacteria bacterium]|nr:nucleotidyltransferase family protein [Kofleriaceae bacterium]